MSVASTGWNDYGGQALDWSSADAIRGRLLLPYCAVLWKALEERVAAVYDPYDYSPWGILSEYLDEPAPGVPLSSGWLYRWQTALTASLHLYANHTDNSGDWDGASDVQFWTDATAAAAIGADRILYSPADIVGGVLPLAEWARQQYELINLMRWVRHDAYTGAGETRVGAGANWAAAQAAWNAAAWVPTGTSGGPVAAWSRLRLVEYSAVRWRAPMATLFSTFGAPTCTCDFYAGPVREAWFYSGTESGVFDDQGDGYTEGRYALVESAEHALTTPQSTAAFGDGVVPDQGPIAADLYYGWSVYSAPGHPEGYCVTHDDEYFVFRAPSTASTSSS